MNATIKLVKEEEIHLYLSAIRVAEENKVTEKMLLSKLNGQEIWNIKEVPTRTVLATKFDKTESWINRRLAMLRTRGYIQIDGKASYQRGKAFQPIYRNTIKGNNFLKNY